MLSQAHAQAVNTVETVSKTTGLPTEKLNEIVNQIGGEGSFGRFASMFEGGGSSDILSRFVS